MDKTVEEQRNDFKNNGRVDAFYVKSMPIFSACLSLHIYLSKYFKKSK